jgi:hypothetical protein
MAPGLKTMETKLQFGILPQPDDTTCGPTCLQAIYRYYDDPVSLDQVISEVHGLQAGGTLAVFLACHALRRGYSAKIYTYNLHMFDPSWFSAGSAEFLSRKLIQQKDVKQDDKITISTRGYLEFLKFGGELRFEDLTSSLIRYYLKRSVPILTGMSSTFLYQSTRELESTNLMDDVQGEPVGHFVVFCGYDKGSREVLVADPYLLNPLGEGQFYTVSIERAIGAIYLGVLTHDANFLIVQPKKKIKKS